MNRVAQSVPAASCGSVSLSVRTPGGTPGELAGADACAALRAGSGPRRAIWKPRKLSTKLCGGFGFLDSARIRIERS